MAIQTIANTHPKLVLALEKITDPAVREVFTSMLRLMQELQNCVAGVVNNNAGLTVTGVTATEPIVSSGGVTPNISLNSTAVTPGIYGNLSTVVQFTVDQKGRLTQAANVSIGNITLVGDATGIGIPGGNLTIILANTSAARGNLGLGNISTINLNGNGSTILLGNGTFDNRGNRTWAQL